VLASRASRRKAGGRGKKQPHPLCSSVFFFFRVLRFVLLKISGQQLAASCFFLRSAAKKHIR
jgi:hypothetical protein